jgi:hypothetical protein
MTKREKVLSLIVGGVFVVLLNLFLLSFFMRNHGRLQSDLEVKKRSLEGLEVLQADRVLWQERDAWLKGNLPRLEDPESAGVKLLEEVKDVARKHTVLVTPQQRAIDLVVRKPDYAAVRVNVDATSSWGGLVDFLAGMQGPGKFVVFEKLNLKKDSTDLTKMRADLRVAKWYAPN